MHHIMTLYSRCSRLPCLTLLISTLCLYACTWQPTPPADSVVPGVRAPDLAQDLPASPLKTALLNCATTNFQRTDFSIAHRGAPLFYPEHTRESYAAAAAMGAGLIECDVTFTRDGALVCRHSQCDLHTTTNILTTPLAARCSEPFTAATDTAPANARCCTSDISLAEYRSLCGRRDHVDRQARTLEDYLATPDSPIKRDAVACGTLLTHAESIRQLAQLGVKYVPELKGPMVAMPFTAEGSEAQITQEDYAARLLDEYLAAGIDPTQVFPQSFNFADVLYWIQNYPDFAPNVVYLDPRGRDPNFKASLANMQTLKAQGLHYIAPPMPMLITLDADGQLAATDYARYAHAAGLKIITWTFEAGRATDPANWLYMSIPGFLDKEAKMLEVLDFLAKEVKVSGVFSDWPGTVTYYANCAMQG